MHSNAAFAQSVITLPDELSFFLSPRKVRIVIRGVLEMRLRFGGTVRFTSLCFGVRHVVCASAAHMVSV